MKKFFIAMLICMLIVMPCTAYAETPIKLFINGQEVYSDPPPQIIDDRVMVPLRVVSERIGAEVLWNGNTRTVWVNGKNSSSNYNAVFNQVCDNYLKVINDIKYALEKRNESLLYEASRTCDKYITILIQVIPPPDKIEIHKLLLSSLETTKTVIFFYTLGLNEINNGNVASASRYFDISTVLLKYESAKINNFLENKRT